MQNCEVCNKSYPSDPHHLTPIGAGGNDTDDNVIPLCRHHHAEFHKIGLSKMMFKYPRVKNFLVRHNRQDLLDRAQIIA